MSDLLLYGVSSKDLGTLVEKVVKILVEKGLISKENPKLKAKSFRSTYDLDIKYKVGAWIVIVHSLVSFLSCYDYFCRLTLASF